MPLRKLYPNQTNIVLLVLALFACLSVSAQAAPLQNEMRELTFMNGEIQLEGTLYLPPGTGPFPAVVIIHGAGPDTRSPYIPDAQMLRQAGIAALVYDKRGAGESTGDWRTASLDELIADALAAVHLVQAQPEVDPRHVGILGISQGAWLAPFAAARDDQVAFIIQVTGSGTPLANQEMWDDGNSLKQLGFSDRAIALEMKALHMLYSGHDLVRKDILPLGDLWFAYYDPYLDPASAWSEVKIPTLALFAERDALVPTQSSLEIVSERLTHPASRVVVFPNRTHALGGASRNNDRVYSTLVTDWIVGVTHQTPLPAMPYGDAVKDTGNLRWHGIGTQETAWYNTIYFQLGSAVFFLLVFLSAILAGLFSRMNAWSRLLLGATGLVNLVVLAGWGLVLNYLLNADARSASPVIPMSAILVWLALLSVVLTMGLTYSVAKECRERNLSSVARFFSGLAVFAGILFIPFMGYWHLLGGQL